MVNSICPFKSASINPLSEILFLFQVSKPLKNQSSIVTDAHIYAI
jgi:hypothetical protein